MDNKHIFLISATVLSVIVGMAAGNQQSITLYESTVPNSKNETFTINVRNLFACENGTKLIAVSMACIHSKGIWMYYTNANYSTAVGTFGTMYHPTDNNVTSCTHYILEDITSIRHVGHSDLSSSAISLYTNDKMENGLEFYFEGYKLILPFIVHVNSYAFTGVKNWIISDNVPIENVTLEQQKQHKCLDITRMNGNKSVDNNNGLAYNERLYGSLFIKYIQRSCTGNETIVIPEGSAGLGQNETAKMEEDAIAVNGPGLILTVKVHGNEVGDLTMIGAKLGLINPIQITNFTFIGSSCFTIYETVDFMGNKTCLVPGTQITDAEYGNKTEYTVGSISIGCLNNDTRCKNGSNNSAFMISSMQLMFSSLVAILVTYFK